MDLTSDFQYLQNIEGVKSETISSALKESIPELLKTLASEGKTDAVVGALEYCSKHKNTDLLEGISPQVIEQTLEWLNAKGNFKAANSVISIGRAVQASPALAEAYKESCHKLSGPILENVETALAMHKDRNDDFSSFVGGKPPAMVEEIFIANQQPCVS